MRGQLKALLTEMGRNLRDLLPILCVIAFFQVVIIGAPMPDLDRRIVGAVCALFGITLLVRGLSMSLFPLGDRIADWLARRGSVTLLLTFAFALGIGSTIAEPALSAVARQAAIAAAGIGTIGGEEAEIARFALFLRYTVATSVGFAVAVGVLRIVKGWPVAWFVLPGYALAAVLALAAQPALAAISFDAGAAATSAINVPLMLALGIGLAATIRERNPLLDGFGVVALASLTPMLVMLLVSLVLT